MKPRPNYRDYVEYARHVKPMRAFRILKAFTSFNRVQLGRGLREALEWLEYEVYERGPETVEASLVEVSTSHLPDSYPPPPGWTVHQAWLEVSGGARIDLESAPTLAAAHTPPSEGVLEAELRLIRNPLDPWEYEKAKGKIALVTGVSLPLAYVMAAEAGAAAVAYYRRDLPPGATPYAGIFLPASLIRKYGIPAVSIPYSIAANGDGRIARLFVDSDVAEESRVPILEVTVLGRDGPECGGLASAVAHACHPEPGANDNGSGVAALIEAALALAEASEAGRLPCSVTLYLLPEFTGSILVALRRNRPRFAANLDMVGGRDGDVGGNWFHAPPAPMINADVAEAYTLARIAYYNEGVELELNPFTAGSDHVPFLHAGASSFMLNQWPDKYYHSDYDDVDRISKTHLKAAAAALASILAAQAGGGGGLGAGALDRFASYYVLRLAERHELRGDRVALALALTTLKTALGLPSRVEEAGASSDVWEQWMRNTYPKLKSYPLMTVSVLAGLNLDVALKLEETLKGEGLKASSLDLYTAALIEPQLLADGSRSLAYILELIAAEHGTRAAKIVPKTLELLEEADVVDLA
ncbi:M28 family peptidase [Stetteria hydrogenophila]